MCMDCSEVDFLIPDVMYDHVGSYHFFAIIFFQSISRPALSCFKVTSSLCFNFLTSLLNLCIVEHCIALLNALFYILVSATSSLLLCSNKHRGWSF
jgi:hypothetical protein